MLPFAVIYANTKIPLSRSFYIGISVCRSLEIASFPTLQEKAIYFHMSLTHILTDLIFFVCFSSVLRVCLTSINTITTCSALAGQYPPYLLYLTCHNFKRKGSFSLLRGLEESNVSVRVGAWSISNKMCHKI